MKVTFRPVTYAVKTRDETLEFKEFRILEDKDSVYGDVVTKINKGMHVKMGYGLFHGNAEDNKAFLEKYFQDDMKWIYVSEDMKSMVIPFNFLERIRITNS